MFARWFVVLLDWRLYNTHITTHEIKRFRERVTNVATALWRSLAKGRISIRQATTEEAISNYLWIQLKVTGGAPTFRLVNNSYATVNGVATNKMHKWSVTSRIRCLVMSDEWLLHSVCIKCQRSAFG